MLQVEVKVNKYVTSGNTGAGWITGGADRESKPILFAASTASPEILPLQTPRHSPVNNVVILRRRTVVLHRRDALLHSSHGSLLYIYIMNSRYK
jgi:hypothetical protein